MASEDSGQGGRNRLLAALTSEDHCLLAPHLKVMSFELGLLLQEPEKPIEYVYFPHQGMISLLAVMSDGQGIETATVGSEGVVGAMSGFGIRWLLQTRDRIDTDGLPLTQEFLAQMLGVRRTTVTLVARQLEQAGLIQTRRGRIVVLDRKGLEDVACECYAIVRGQMNIRAVLKYLLRIVSGIEQTGQGMGRYMRFNA
jgi:CRP-like cAMP-binding protein